MSRIVRPAIDGDIYSAYDSKQGTNTVTHDIPLVVRNNARRGRARHYFPTVIPHTDPCKEAGCEPLFSAILKLANSENLPQASSQPSGILHFLGLTALEPQKMREYPHWTRE